MIKEQIVRIETDGNETKAEVIGEIVRCKDCRCTDCRWHDENYCHGFTDSDYCSFGRRKETDDGRIETD